MPGIAPVVGRDTELMAVSRFTDEFAADPVTLLIEGEPGIGKTTIWSHAVRLATERGYAVLTSRPTQSEARLSFAALGDLVDGVATRLLPALPGPQRPALEIALLRADSAGHPPDRRAVSLAFLHMLRLRGSARARARPGGEPAARGQGGPCTGRRGGSAHRRVARAGGRRRGSTGQPGPGRGGRCHRTLGERCAFRSPAARLRRLCRRVRDRPAPRAPQAGRCGDRSGGTCQASGTGV
jgi:AAA ATPase-like protein